MRSRVKRRNRPKPGSTRRVVLAALGTFYTDSKRLLPRGCKMHSLAIAVVLGTIIMCSLASQAGDNSKYYANGKEVSKVEALLTLAREPGAGVVRCIPQELSEKATLRNVKKK